MEQTFTYSKSGIMPMVELSAAEKRERVRSAVNQALNVYRRHSVFTVAVSKKGVGGFDCFVIPRSSDLPKEINPAAFNYCGIWKSHWNSVPESILDQIEKWYF